MISLWNVCGTSNWVDPNLQHSSTAVGWEGPSLPQGSLGLMGTSCYYCTPVCQVVFVNQFRHPRPARSLTLIGCLPCPAQ
jgi:hypothetical protein